MSTESAKCGQPLPSTVLDPWREGFLSLFCKCSSARLKLFAQHLPVHEEKWFKLQRQDPYPD